MIISHDNNLTLWTVKNVTEDCPLVPEEFYKQRGRPITFNERQALSAASNTFAYRALIFSLKRKYLCVMYLKLFFLKKNYQFTEKKNYTKATLIK